MKLKTIKSKIGNMEYNELISKTIELIKAEFELNLRYHNLFFLCWYNSAMVFLYQNTVIIASGEYEIMWHLFRWGSDVKILSPISLRKKYIEMLENTMKHQKEK